MKKLIMLALVAVFATAEVALFAGCGCGGGRVNNNSHQGQPKNNGR
jgi:hypothetical protein